MITVLSGTNRKNSNTLAVANIVMEKFFLLGEKAQLLDLSQLPSGLFEPDHYFNPPESFAPFQKMVTEGDGLLVVVPEYNGSFPGALKYFIDLLKFPDSLKEQPAAFVGVAAGQFGALRSIEQLELIFQYREAHLFNKRLLFAKVNELLSEDKKKIVSDYHNDKLMGILEEFSAFVEALKKTR